MSDRKIVRLKNMILLESKVRKDREKSKCRMSGRNAIKHDKTKHKMK